MHSRTRLIAIGFIAALAAGGALAEESPPLTQRVGHALERAGEATAYGVKRGAQATAHGVKVGVDATGRELTKAGEAVGHAVHKAAEKTESVFSGK